jgi:hypothetical protein
MIDFLNKPYPHDSFSLKDIRANLWIGLFISIFLIVFQPFGANEWQTNHKILKLLGFGFVSFLFPSIIQLLLSLLFSNNAWMDNWKIWKEILAILIVLVFIAFGNMFLAYLYGLTYFYLNQFIPVLTITCLIGAFPVTASVAFKYQRFLSLNKKTANEIDQEIEKRKTRESTGEPAAVKTAGPIIFIAENNKDTFELFPHQLLYIESADNYSTIFFMDHHKKKKELIRSSLKRLESQITEASILRCHRSYIVNIASVAHIEGNAQGYRISFKDTEETIPVSRNYGKAILERLRSLSGN